METFEQVTESRDKLREQVETLLAACKEAYPVLRNATDETDQPWRREIRSAILSRVGAAIANAEGKQ